MSGTRVVSGFQDRSTWPPEKQAWQPALHLSFRVTADGRPAFKSYLANALELTDPGPNILSTATPRPMEGWRKQILLRFASMQPLAFNIGPEARIVVKTLRIRDSADI